MNGYLLDTHTFLWSLFKPEKLGKTARVMLSESSNTVQVKQFLKRQEQEQ